MQMQRGMRLKNPVIKSATAIGLFGAGETLTVGSLGPDSTYTVKVVIRDLGTGQETVIAGQSISKGVNP